MTTTDFQQIDSLPGVAFVGVHGDRIYVSECLNISIYVSECLNISQARDLRNWLSRALPCECPVCRRFLQDDEIIGSCANTKDGHHRRVITSKPGADHGA